MSNIQELLKLRKKITNVVQVLTHVKEKLQFIQAETIDLKGELKKLDEKVTSKRDSLPSLKNVMYFYRFIIRLEIN